MISVVVPNYNHAAFLKQRLDSILNQSYSDFELIILDDYSTDDSRNIIEEYRKNLKVSHIIYNDTNSGSTFKQWQKALDLAKGDWVWIAESDDYAHVDLLSTLVELTNDDESCVLAYCATMHIDEQDNNIGLNDWAYELDRRRWENRYVSSGLTEIMKYFKYRNTIPNASAVLFSRQFAYEINNIANKSMKYTGDWIFWMQLVKHGSLAYTPLILNFQRTHGNTSRSRSNLSSEIKRIKEYIDAIKIAASISKTKISWGDKYYDWVFEQYSKQLSLNYKTLFMFFGKTFSYSFVKRVLKSY